MSAPVCFRVCAVLSCLSSMLVVIVTHLVARDVRHIHLIRVELVPVRFGLRVGALRMYHKW
eukprot:42163-Eustigmatos_ZCMA.PRE.1